ncbi:NmrA family transcriptional regulator [Roseivirga sp. 4D4]|uniref:SDR family oxidoreductase n=1 Tax=Roseivirga sp. 4D4 TaxID=1889784 RepID=UPI0008535F33|nr:NAD(P)H-binding protein [Roseivirga sp. 4D4]OEK00388.1 NmrA family transcriptional regulator [Roseivirga sp. 4D4]
MTQNNILVIGGTGKTGRKVVERLTRRGINVRIGSRNASPSFDWEKPEDWKTALQGMDKVYITFQPDLAVPGAKEAITELTEQSKACGIKKLVILSGRGEHEAELCEQIIQQSGIDWSVVRADWFNQNFSESFFLDPILAGQVAVPRAETKIPFTDTDDIADVVVEALLDDQYTGEVLELTGPELWSMEEVIKEIAKVTNREIGFHSISLEDYTKMMRDHQVPDAYIWLINYLFTNVLDGRNSSTTNTIEEVLGRPAKRFSDYVKETAATGVWNG